MKPIDAGSMVAPVATGKAMSIASPSVAKDGVEPPTTVPRTTAVVVASLVDEEPPPVGLTDQVPGTNVASTSPPFESNWPITW